MTTSTNEPPRFPDWNQVLHHLFATKSFRSCGLDTESLSHYLQQRRVFESKYDFPVSGADLIAQSIELAAIKNLGLTSVSEEEMLQRYKELITPGNHFTLIGNPSQLEFLKVSENAKELLKLDSPYDINLPRICGLDDTFELYHPEDVQHIVRLGLSAIFITTIKGVVIHPFKDHYQVEFRMGYKDPERFVTATRSCHLSNAEGEQGNTRHMDVWKIDPGHNEFIHVRGKIETREPGPMRDVIQSLFYATNCFLLKLNPRDVVLANLICIFDTHDYPHELNKRCEEACGVGSGYFEAADCATMKRNLLRKVNSRVLNNTKGAEWKESVEKKSFNWKCGQLGILNLPPLLEETIWKEVEAIEV
jgi:hypothetical protein